MPDEKQLGTVAKSIDDKYKSNIGMNMEYFIHSICLERGWTLKQFYDLPLGEQEEIIAFHIVYISKANFDNMRELKLNESASKQKSPNDSQAFINKLRKEKEEKQKRRGKIPEK